MAGHAPVVALVPPGRRPVLPCSDITRPLEIIMFRAFQLLLDAMTRRSAASAAERHLSAMSDRELADIGLTRGSIRQAIEGR